VTPYLGVRTNSTGFAPDGAPDGFDHRFGVVDADANAQRHQERNMKQCFPAGGFAEEFALAKTEEGAGRAGGQNEEAEAEDIRAQEWTLKGVRNWKKIGYIRTVRITIRG